MKKLILMIPLLFSCTVQEATCPEDKTAKFEAQIVEIEAQIAQLKVDKIFYCAALAEMISDGKIEYVGENKFAISGEIYEAMSMEEMIKVCEADLKKYIELVRDRTK